MEKTIVWLTGWSGAGKTTLAASLVLRLHGLGFNVELLDGDEIRQNLCKGLGYSKQDRDTNVLRVGYVAKLLARNGTIAVVAAISPYTATRNRVRRQAEDEGVRFLEVHVRCPLENLKQRDPKGLYEKALAGKIENFTGISDPYEDPINPELVLDTDVLSVSTCVEQLMALVFPQTR